MQVWFVGVSYGCGYLGVALVSQIVQMSRFVLDLPLNLSYMFVTDMADDTEDTITPHSVHCDTETKATFYLNVLH